MIEWLNKQTEKYQMQRRKSNGGGVDAVTTGTIWLMLFVDAPLICELYKQTHTMSVQLRECESTFNANIDEPFSSTLRWLGEWVRKAAATQRTTIENDWNKL